MTHGNLFIVVLCQIKKQLACSQCSQGKLTHYNGEEWGNQGNTGTKQSHHLANIKHCGSMTHIQGSLCHHLAWKASPLWLCGIEHTWLLFWTRSTQYLNCPSYISSFWYLPYIAIATENLVFTYTTLSNIYSRSPCKESGPAVSFLEAVLES